MAELQQELKSLKALLLSRGPSVSGGLSTPVIPKPSIPAWQLTGGGISSPSTPPLSVSQSSTFVPNGKGKEIEIPSESGSSS